MTGSIHNETQNEGAQQPEQLSPWSETQAGTGRVWWLGLQTRSRLSETSRNWISFRWFEEKILTKAALNIHNIIMTPPGAPLFAMNITLYNGLIKVISVFFLALGSAFIVWCVTVFFWSIKPQQERQTFLPDLWGLPHHVSLEIEGLGMWPTDARSPSCVRAVTDGRGDPWIPQADNAPTPPSSLSSLSS